MKLETTIPNMTSGEGYSIETKGNIPMEITILPVEQTVTKVVIKIDSSEHKQYAELFHKTIDENIPKKAVGDDRKAK